MIPGIFFAAFPDVLSRTMKSAEEAAKMKSKLRKMGFVLIGVSVIYLFLVLVQPHGAD